MAKTQKLTKLTSKEITPLLAALRFFQAHADEAAFVCWQFDEYLALTEEEIDELCEKLNFGETYIEYRV